MSRQRFIAKGYSREIQSLKCGIAKFLSLIPPNGSGVIAYPIISQLKHCILKDLLVEMGFEKLTKGERRMSLDNGATLHLGLLNAETLRGANIILAIWPLNSDMPVLEKANRWQSLVVVGEQEGDWRDWEAEHAPIVIFTKN